MNERQARSAEAGPDDNATVGSGSIVNEVQYVYNDFGQTTTSYQSHSGVVVP